MTEDTVKLLQYCCWENPHLSRTVLSELLWQIGFAYTHELRHHTDLLLTILLMEDSWQTHRVHNALKGKFVFSREIFKLVLLNIETIFQEFPMSERVYLKRSKEVKTIIKRGLTNVLSAWCSSLVNVDLPISFYIIVRN